MFDLLLISEHCKQWAVCAHEHSGARGPSQAASGGEENVSSPPSGLGTRLGTRLDKTLSHQQNWSFSRNYKGPSESSVMKSQAVSLVCFCFALAPVFPRFEAELCNAPQ